MMRPPRLPSSYPSTGLRLAIEDSSPILLALESAGAVIDTEEKRGALTDAINSAILRFTDARDAGTSQPEFHREIKQFREALSTFICSIPQCGSSLSQALTDEWRNIVAQREWSDDWVSGRRDEIDDEWNFSFPHPAALESLRQSLYTLTYAVNALSAAEQVGVRGKPPYREDQRLVADLQKLFEDLTQTYARRSIRNQRARAEVNDQRTRAQGSFGLFVRAVDDELYRALIAAFTTQPVKQDRPMTTQEAQAEADKYRIRGLAAMIATVLTDNRPKAAD